MGQDNLAIEFFETNEDLMRHVFPDVTEERLRMQRRVLRQGLASVSIGLFAFRLNIYLNPRLWIFGYWHDEGDDFIISSNLSLGPVELRFWPYKLKLRRWRKKNV